MTRFEIEKRLQLISGYSKKIVDENLLEDELSLNKMISFLTTTSSDIIEKLLTIIPRGEKYQYLTEEENFMYNMTVLAKCVDVVDEEDSPIIYKTLGKYRYCIAKKFIKEVDKSMRNNGDTPQKLSKCK